MSLKSILTAGISAVVLAATAGAALAEKSASDGTSASGMPQASGATQEQLDELQQRLDALEAEVQASEQRAAETKESVSKWQDKLAGWWNNTSISGRMYFDVSNIDHSSTDGSGKHKLPDDGTNFDIKRFYVSIDHQFDDTYSADITTDVTYDSSTKASQIFIKKAYLQAKWFGDAATFRIGSADMPWIPFVEGIYGYRYVENTLIDRTKFGTSADWGIHVLGKFADGLINYQVSAINGAGYKVAPIGGGANRSKGIDVEGRVNVNWNGLILGGGFYTGQLGKDVEGTTTYHTANRWDAVAAYVNGDIHAGVEYFNANDWNNVTTVASDSAEGFGPFISYKIMPQFTVFGRYDYVTPNQDTNSKLHDNYYNFGVTWSPAKIVDFSLVYKHDDASHGTISTSNGTIGGSVKGSYSEIGLFGQFQW
jgi:hypothetical protein